MIKSQKSKLFFLSSLIFFNAVRYSEAATVFEDNFDSWDDYSCINSISPCPNVPAPWRADYALDPTAPCSFYVDSIGARSGKSARSEWPSSYGGVVGPTLNTGSIGGSYDEIYLRYYLKFDENSYMDFGNGMKLFRWRSADDTELFRLELSGCGVYDDEWNCSGFYLDADSTGQTYRPHVNQGGHAYTWAMFNGATPNTNDTAPGSGMWRSLELHVKFGATLGTDEAELYIDGTSVWHMTGMSLRNNINQHMDHTTLSENTDSFHGAMYFDDYVISTTYVGTISGQSDVIAPTAPEGLSVM